MATINKRAQSVPTMAPTGNPSLSSYSSFMPAFLSSFGGSNQVGGLLERDGRVGEDRPTSILYWSQEDIPRRRPHLLQNSGTFLTDLTQLGPAAGPAGPRS